MTDYEVTLPETSINEESMRENLTTTLRTYALPEDVAEGVMQKIGKERADEAIEFVLSHPSLFSSSESDFHERTSQLCESVRKMSDFLSLNGALCPEDAIATPSHYAEIDNLYASPFIAPGEESINYLNHGVDDEIPSKVQFDYEGDDFFEKTSDSVDFEEGFSAVEAIHEELKQDLKTKEFSATVSVHGWDAAIIRSRMNQF